MWHYTDWNYLKIDAKRTQTFTDQCSYAVLVEHLLENVESIKFQIDKGYLQPVTDALRPLFFVKFTEGNEHYADAFFSARYGYRAQYYSCPELGLRANKFIISKFKVKLLEAASNASYTYNSDQNEALNMTEEEMLHSLDLSSAKVWGDETEGHFQTIVSNDQDSIANITANRWVSHAQSGIQKACKGIKAPKVEKLKFHGAFVKNGKELIPPGKEVRSEEINLYGFT